MSVDIQREAGGGCQPSHFALQSLIRKNIWDLHPYRCARDDYQSGILLDANENALGPSLPNTDESLNLHRYPDPSHVELKTLVAKFRNLPSSDYVFLGVGSDEIIDLLMRISCSPSKDKILVTPPTYGMYPVCAQVNDLVAVKIPLSVEAGTFKVQVEEVKRVVKADQSIKLIFLCSPGNPTGTLVPLPIVKELLDFPDFKGIVVVDEAYIDFAEPGVSAVDLVHDYGNVCVMQTLSKSFGLAAIRLGMALAQPPLITILSNTKAPYNISTLTAEAAKGALSSSGIDLMRGKVAHLTRLRAHLLSVLDALRGLGLGTPIGGNSANFLLVPVLKRGATSNKDFDNERSVRVYKRLAEEMGVVVRYRGSEHGCGGCLRITVGSEDENKVLLARLKQVLEEEK
ncbi:histidinol-phosphate transaminase [Tulasnella sp. JGI-2019a]|nr:histidinol-phosphate transaminase [Tulasnella sp. JGI-2019a]KAG9011679.1 histidinol-phosphate transaminase [Tulasnella sp. JGI-2019a]KAG9038751.1 histidinol-phosphate transaminase [Tulasnella sp. JGI-2019a]